MKLLFVNDDGYDAIGINTLYHSFASHYETYMCAPLLHKSAFSHAINFQGELEIVSLTGEVHGYALNGTPADCSKAALSYLFVDESPFDRVLSGINYGVNIGKDIFYSGTVGAAREAMLHGYLGVAFSQEISLENGWDAKPYFQQSASYARQIFEALPSELLAYKHEMVLNINFPLSLNVEGIKVATLCNQTYNFDVKKTEFEGSSYISFHDVNTVWPQEEEGSDYDCLQQGYISITALYKGFDIHPKAQKILSVLEKLTLK